MLASLPSTKQSMGYRVTTLMLAFASNVFAGLVSTLMAAYLPDSVRDFMGSATVEDVSHVGSYVGLLFLVGWALGGMLMGWGGDRFGRVHSFTASVFLYAAFTLASAWSPTWYVLVACRFFAGIGVGATLVLSAVIVAEVWNRRTRAVALGIVAVGYPIGIASSGLVTYAVADWRTGFLAGFLPLLLALLCGTMLRESEQWRNLQRSRKRMNLGYEVSQLLAPAIRKDFLIGATIFGTMLVGLWATFSWLPAWVQSLIGPGDTGQEEGGLAVMLLGLGGILGSTVSGFVANALGRKRALLLTFGGCFIASFLLFKTNDVFTPLVYTETVFLALFFGISQGILTAYVPELFPMPVRSTATGICFNAGRLITAAAVFLVGILVPVLGGYGNALFVFSLTYFLGFLVTLFGKETRGKEL